MDKSALFWKMTSDKTLETEHSTKGKYDKVCITINLVCNFTRSHKPKPWFITKAVKP